MDNKRGRPAKTPGRQEKDIEMTQALVKETQASSKLTLERLAEKLELSVDTMKKYSAGSIPMGKDRMLEVAYSVWLKDWGGEAAKKILLEKYYENSPTGNDEGFKKRQAAIKSVRDGILALLRMNRDCFLDEKPDDLEEIVRICLDDAMKVNRAEEEQQDEYERELYNSNFDPPGPLDEPGSIMIRHKNSCLATIIPKSKIFGKK